MKIITRIKGGLGNQLYCYAAARRLAIKNNAELVIDDVTGFKRDYEYKRKYILNHFNIACRKATPFERLEPFERIRRGLFKKIEKLKFFKNRNYIEQEFDDFDSRLLDIKISKTIYVDGLWQSLKYFEDVEAEIRKDLIIIPPQDKTNLDISLKIKNELSIAVHIRWFNNNDKKSTSNASTTYYKNAINHMEESLESPHYFVFSDNLEAVKENIKFPDKRVTYVNNNTKEDEAIWDFWLMSKCKHFIIANSTFSWWAAWLSQSEEKKTVVFPRLPKHSDTKWAWDFEGQMLNTWHPIIL